jgi:peptidoglycan/xylan/chitin deacetylase (PgdA/CDA1 family)
MQLLALKIDVDTLRGTREGVPRLVEALRRHGAGATFLFSLGPDHTGRALKRAFRPGFLRKVSRTSVLEHYGVRTLLYGTLLPGPDIGRRAAEEMRAVAAAGFEVGIHCWDHVRWQDGVRHADEAWTRRELRSAAQRFEAIFGAPPATHGAAGWQMNAHALRWLQDAGIRYASDCRGSTPFLPVLQGELLPCLQLPTTLPTLDELIGTDGLDAANVAAHLLERTRQTPATGHVFTLHAELEGMKLLPIMEALLEGWRAQGWRLVALRELAEAVSAEPLPRHQFLYGSVPGRSGELCMQGPIHPPPAIAGPG